MEYAYTVKAPDAAEAERKAADILSAEAPDRSWSVFVEEVDDRPGFYLVTFTAD